MKVLCTVLWHRKRSHVLGEMGVSSRWFLEKKMEQKIRDMLQRHFIEIPRIVFPSTDL